MPQTKTIATPLGEITHYCHGFVSINPEKRVEKWVTPLFVQIAVTYKCNLRCPWCYAESAPEKQECISPDILKRVLKALDGKVIGISFGGGEPLTYPYLREILDYARKRTGLVLSITTNGLLLEENKWILTKLDELRISIYPETRQKIKKIIPEVKRKKPKLLCLGINLMLRRKNMEWLKETYYMLEPYIDDVLITKFFPEGRGNHKEWEPTESDIAELMSFVKSISHRKTIKLTGELGRLAEKKYGLNVLNLMPESTVSISPDLYVSPSSIHRDVRIKIDTPDEILNAYRKLVEMRAYTRM